LGGFGRAKIDRHQRNGSPSPSHPAGDRELGNLQSSSSRQMRPPGGIVRGGLGRSSLEDARRGASSNSKVQVRTAAAASDPAEDTRRRRRHGHHRLLQQARRLSSGSTRRPVPSFSMPSSSIVDIGREAPGIAARVGRAVVGSSASASADAFQPSRPLAPIGRRGRAGVRRRPEGAGVVPLALVRQRRPGCALGRRRVRRARQTLRSLDDISNIVCTVIDAAKLCRLVHADPQWR